MPCAPQNLFLLFAQSWASLKIFFWRLPSLGQVSNYFFIVCPTLGKSQIIFLAFAQPWASLKLFFYRLPSFGQVSNLFFGVCPALGKSQIYFLAFAQPWASLKIFFWRLLKLSRHPILFFEVCSSGMVGAVPMCPPERPRSGVSIPKYICASRIMHEDLTMDAPSRGDTGGHTGTAPTKLHHTFLHHSIKRHYPSTCNPPMINGHFGHRQ